jgi:hypothetical protein
MQTFRIRCHFGKLGHGGNMGDESQRVWSEVDRYFSDLLLKRDAILDAALE